MLNRIVLPILIIALAAAGYYGMMLSKQEKPKIQKPEKIWQVHTVPVVFQNISPEITLYGRVETPRKARLKAAIVADVKQASILEGTVVEAGQTLAILDDTDLQILLSQRRAELAEVEALISSENIRSKRDKGLLNNEVKLLDLAENAVARAQKLEKSNLASKANLDDSLADKQRQTLTIERLQYDINEHPARLAGLIARKARAKALLKQAEVDLSRSIIKAPFSGRIAKLDIAAGDRVRVGDPLLMIYDLANLEVRAQIPGRYISSVRKQLEQGLKPSAIAILDGKPVTFDLARLSGEVRQDSGGVDGLFRLTNQMNSLALGTFVELKLQLVQESEVAAIPFNALYELDRVYRLNDGHLEAITIDRVGEYQLGNGEKQLLIRSEQLAESDIIVSTQLPNAITGLRVEPVQALLNE
ncbi:MAG: efflux RND transporter periplasmic adaptor subunit [Methylophagaceae bacterium]